ncbi:sugar phosphate nucleotidyltransferase [Nocardiopsis sp. NPDC006938]|uniref:sugar phosphate nucleotidyltransferase n=1 Tax=Nocardiopsis sp. NPDC006938 TaxID=3364337 RepID=UPI003687209A
MESVKGRLNYAVIAAGGLGTRRADWSRYLPKEYFPVSGRPGIVLLLEEVAALGNVRAVLVHHPYYAAFAAWASRVLTMPDTYYRLASNVPAPPRWPDTTIDLIPQSGPYSDITSVLNADDHLMNSPEHLYVLYSDNLYPGARPVASLRELGAETAVFARPYTRVEAAHRGVLVCDRDHVVGLVEKPDALTARELEARHGRANLSLLEGRARVGRAFLDFLHTYRHPAGEPKLSLAIAAYARREPVRVLRSDTPVTDLGAPQSDGG